MKIADLHWSELERMLERDDRIIIPLGSTEQHAFLSLATDSLLAERIAVDAAEPLMLPVLPVLSFGITPYFLAYPGTISLRVSTYESVLRDMLDSLYFQGFRRFVFMNGHGGNSPGQTMTTDWLTTHAGAKARFHNWWNAPRTWQAVSDIDPHASHGSWMENFPWTRVAGGAQPAQAKAHVDPTTFKWRDTKAARQILGDGSFGGYYERDDATMLKIWSIAVEEARSVITDSWE